MAWLNVGSRLATRDWENVGEVQSDILRLTYTFFGDLPSGGLYGALRERYEFNLYNSRWYALYPKSVASEVLVLDRVRGFEGTTYQARTVQVKKRGGSTDWQIQIEQWL